MPVRMLTSVDSPAPFRPTSPRVSLKGIVMETSLRTGVAPKVFQTDFVAAAI